jgi:hypothetical protein
LTPFSCSRLGRARSRSTASASDVSDQEDEQQPDAAEYLPDRIIAKKTVQWKDFYLIHWLGYTAAERTWEPVAYFDQYCTKQTHDYERARRPQRILALKPRPSAQELVFEVQWQGRSSSESSMEREAAVREDFPELVKEWERVASRKHPRSADEDAGEPPAKRCRTARPAPATV